MQCGCCNQNGCLYSWGAYFVWVLIILIFTVPHIMVHGGNTELSGIPIFWMSDIYICGSPV